jgi:hypothetical protein
VNTYAAKVEDGTVVQVIVGEPAWAAERLGGVWVASKEKVGTGWTYHGDHFRPPQPFASWVWNNIWQSPVEYPNDGNHYNWNEDAQEWVLVTDE